MKYPLYQKTLCPKLWHDKKLNPEAREGLLNIASDFIDELNKQHELEIEILDVVIVGSVANYNWTNYSDIDLHIVTDYTKLDLPPVEAQIMFDAIKAGWNIKHEVTVKGHDVELYVQDKTYHPSSAAEYSVLHDKWLKEPKRERPTFDKELIKKKYWDYKKAIDALLKDHDEDGLKRLLEKLYKFRQAGLDSGGELSEENIIFKILRASGLLEKIKDNIAKLYDKKMTVKEAESRDSDLISVINSTTMYRGARDGNPNVVSGPSYYSSVEIFAKTYGPTAAWKLSLKTPLVVSADEWSDYASSNWNPIQNVVTAVKGGGHDSVVNARDLPNGKKLYTVFLIDPKQAKLYDKKITEIQATTRNFNKFKQVYGVDWSDDELKKLFLRFTNQASRAKEKDIFKYGKLSGLQAVLDEPSKHEKTKAIKNDNVNILLNNENVLVVEPLSMEASILYGKNTKWCTASTRLPKNPFSGEQEDDENGEDDDEEITNRFYTYFKGVTLVYFIDKKTHEKFAIAKHPNEKTSEAFDETDKKIKAEEILSRFGLDWSIFDNAVKKEEKPKIMQRLQDAAAAKKVDDERQKIMAQVETDASGKRFIGGDLVIYFHKKFPDMEDVEVRGRVLCRFIESLEGCPKKVMGDFNCSNSKITTLQGGPRYVGGKFDCSYTNNITTLEGAPDSVGGDFRAHNIFLKSLKGAPRKVGGNYEVSGTFTTLEGGPEEVGDNFKTINCHKLTSIQGAPRIVGGNFYFYDNGKDYTEEEIRAVSKVVGKVFVDRNHYLMRAR